jgi:hypothetical protein
MHLIHKQKGRGQPWLQPSFSAAETNLNTAEGVLDARYGS